MLINKATTESPTTRGKTGAAVNSCNTWKKKKKKKINKRKKDILIGKC
jgi:hypothetical protein